MTNRAAEPEVPASVLAARSRAEVLVSAEDVQQAVDRVAVRLALALCRANPLVLVVMHGGLPYAGELLKRLSFPLELGYLHVSRYRGATSGGTLRWHHEPAYDLAGRTVLLVDDVFDQGETLAALCAWARQAGARRVLTTVLVDKQVGVPRRLDVDYAALVCPDRYLFGCGMDYRGYWRNLTGIYALPPDLEST